MLLDEPTSVSEIGEVLAVALRPFGYTPPITVTLRASAARQSDQEEPPAPAEEPAP